MRAGYVFCSTLIFLCFSASVLGQDTLSSVGSGVGVNRDEALMAAKRDAIEKGIGMVLLSQTEIENFQLKRDIVITKTFGAVKSYTILSESRSPDSLFKIKIKATLSKDLIHRDLAQLQILIESMNKPKIMVIIDETNTGIIATSNCSSENSIIRFLQDPYGFDLVDQKMIQTIKSNSEKMDSLNGKAPEAAAIANQFGAEVLIMGNAVSRKSDELSQNLGGMVSVGADVTLKAINCTTGRIIGSSSEHAAKVHASPLTAGKQAIEKASEKAAAKLLDAIVKDWQDQLNNGLSLSVTVKGVSTFSLKNTIVNSLKALPGVTSLYERSWNSGSSLLQIDIKYKGNSEGFCSKADGYKLNNANINLSVTGVNGFNISLTAKNLQ
jgi:hypothetical protein